LVTVIFTCTGPQRVWITEPVVVFVLDPLPDEPVLDPDDPDVDPAEPELDTDGLLAEGATEAVLAPAAGLAWSVDVW
jgi:hypothetical protein